MAENDRYHPPPVATPHFGAAQVFTQEKIRWLTFQAGAVILGHTLVSYYLPSLELGQLASSLMAAWNNSRNGDSRNDDHRGAARSRENSTTDDRRTDGPQPLRLLPFRRCSGDRDDGTAARGGHGHTRNHAGDSFQHDGNNEDDDGKNDDDSVHDDSYNPGRLGAREPVTPGPGRAGNGSNNGGSHRASGRGDARADGLDGLNRQVLLASLPYTLLCASAGRPPRRYFVRRIVDKGLTGGVSASRQPRRSRTYL